MLSCSSSEQIHAHIVLMKVEIVMLVRSIRIRTCMCATHIALLFALLGGCLGGSFCSGCGTASSWDTCSDLAHFANELFGDCGCQESSECIEEEFVNAEIGGLDNGSQRVAGDVLGSVAQQKGGI